MPGDGPRRMTVTWWPCVAGRCEVGGADRASRRTTLTVAPSRLLAHSTVWGSRRSGNSRAPDGAAAACHPL